MFAPGTSSEKFKYSVHYRDYPDNNSNPVSDTGLNRLYHPAPDASAGPSASIDSRQSESTRPNLASLVSHSNNLHGNLNYASHDFLSPTVQSHKTLHSPLDEISSVASLPFSHDSSTEFPRHSNFKIGPIPSTSIVTVSAMDRPGNSEPSSVPSETRLDSHNPRKARRQKPRIALAPDQPPTTQGKPRARVYVACLQCRTRKIRCDGAKPVCHNCGRRPTGSHQCNYDPVPKRRGPDKTPGLRQRLAREVRDGEGGRRRRRRRDSPPAGAPGREVGKSSTSSTGPKSGRSVLETSLSPPSTQSADYIPSPAELYPSSHLPPPSNLTSQTYISSPSTLSPTTGHPISPGFDHRNVLPSSSRYDQSHLRESPTSSFRSYGTEIGHPNISVVDENGDEQEESLEITYPPSLNFTRKIWWDSLLSLYCSPSSNRLQALTSTQRHQAAQDITSDLRFIFKVSNYWFAFFHIPTFFCDYFDPLRREEIQPSLILALLAVSTFWQSSELGHGQLGRERAMRFRDEAQGALEASFNGGWLDETLAQAAWLLALFEICAHPDHSRTRSVSAMFMLDSIVRSLSLTSVDAGDPEATTFKPDAVPAVPTSPTASHLDRTTTGYPLYASILPSQGRGTGRACSCARLTLGQNWENVREHAPMWHATSAWNTNWSQAEIKKESCRRLCWSAIALAAGYTSYATTSRTPGPDLFITDPANYTLLFSGESITRIPALLGQSDSKDTIWALYDRTFLLWHSCARMRGNIHAADAEMAQFAAKAWLEADVLESALNRHTCDLEKNFIFQGREYIFNTRMSISYEFQRYIPLVPSDITAFYRGKAEEWLTHQKIVAQRFMHGLHTITGNANNRLAHRPFFVFWFMGQVSHALALFSRDSTMTLALDVCKCFLPAIDYLSSLWPCPEQRYRYNILRQRLENACYLAGISAPAPPNLVAPAL